MTYDEVIALAESLGIVQSYAFIQLKRGRALEKRYIRFKLRREGKVPELSILFFEIDQRMSKLHKRKFSHNPDLATVIVTLYED
jgi:hypothetical protein